MQLTDHQKKSAIIALATFLSICAVLAVSFQRPDAETQNHPPFRLGTNQLKIGANLYLSNGFHFGRVVKVEELHDFPDGTTQRAALIKPTNTFAIWMPFDKLTNAQVVQ